MAQVFRVLPGRPLELPQQLVPARDRRIERGLCGFFAGESLFQLVLDGVANQHKGAEPEPPGIFRRRLVVDLLDRDLGAGIAIIEALGTGEFKGGLRCRRIAGVLMAAGLRLPARRRAGCGYALRRSPT